jgi:hypothetical protein
MKLQHKRSNVLEAGQPKAPLAKQMEFGELAVNYNATKPTVYLKDDGNNVVSLLDSISKASYTVEGVVEIADSTETGAGAERFKAVAPFTLVPYVTGLINTAVTSITAAYTAAINAAIAAIPQPVDANGAGGVETKGLMNFNYIPSLQELP